MKKGLVFTLVLVMAASLAGCGGGSSSAPATTAAAAAETTAAAAADTTAAAGNDAAGNDAAGAANWDNYDLKLSTNLAEDHVACQGYYAFAETVEKAMDGHVKVTVYPGERLGKESDVISSIAMGAGTCDIVTTGPSELSKYDATFSLFDAPYVFNDGDAMVAFANGDEVQALYDSLAEATNLRCLGMYYYGSREVTVNGYAATEPSGLKGCKLRVPDSEMALAYGAALGATPTVMSLGEVYMGIQAQEAELQDTLKEKGMNIIEVDKDAFKANVQTIYDKYKDTWGDWLATAQTYNK